MHLTLAITTCNPNLEVGLGGGGLACASLVRLAGDSPRSALLLAAVDLLLEDAGLAPADVKQVVVSRGPGSFTGIRAGLATASGLSAAAGMTVIAYDSFSMQAARSVTPGTFWVAQPGRRGEVYARPMRVNEGGLPEADGSIRTLRIEEAVELGPWLAAPGLDLGAADRAPAGRSAAEALLYLAQNEYPPQPAEPLYVEGPPVSGGDGSR